MVLRTFRDTLCKSNARRIRAGLLALQFVLMASALTEDSVILSEFMASNSHTIADENKDFDDWIELRNTGKSPVNLLGWSLSAHPGKPRQWLFPSTNLPPDGHLLVWASGHDRRVAGLPLHTNFRLARDGDYLALRRPDGSVATEFAPKYPAQWPDTSLGFLPGSAQAVIFSAPTPGRPNESTKIRPGPFIASVDSSPHEPKPSDPIVIVATVLPATGEVTNVVLYWRSMFRREETLPMTNSGGNNWAAQLPDDVASTGQMLRWRVGARDTRGGLSSYPPATDSKRSSKYLGLVLDPHYVVSPLPVFQLFMDPRAMDRADSEVGAAGCFYYDGEFYDNVFVKVRGNTTAFFPKKSHRLEFPADHPFRHPGPGGRIRHTSLMAEFGDPTYLRQHLSFWLQSETGSVAPFHDPVRVQLNGGFWQLAMHSEVLGSELLARHGLDPRGALYKAVGTLTPDIMSTGNFEKKTRRQEGLGDYVELAQHLNDDQPPAQRRRALFDRMNLPAVINYLAVARLTQEDDDVWANMSLYHDNEGSGEWRPVAFDMNVSWGLSFSSGAVQATRDEGRSHPFFGAADTGQLQGYNQLYDAVVQTPETREMLLRRMRTILDRWWQPPGTPPDQRVIELHIAQMTNLIAGDAMVDRAKWGGYWGSRSSKPEQALAAGISDLINRFIEPRRRHFYITHSITNASGRRKLGVTYRDIAGIPLPQSEDARLEFAGVNLYADRPELDVVTLTNASAQAVDVSRWSLKGRVSFTFAGGTVLPAHGVLHVASDVEKFRSQVQRTPPKSPRFVVGNFRGKHGDAKSISLVNERGGRVALLDSPP